MSLVLCQMTLHVTVTECVLTRLLATFLNSVNYVEIDRAAPRHAKNDSCFLENHKLCPCW
jgi:hypothetical protein